MLVPRRCGVGPPPHEILQRSRSAMCARPPSPVVHNTMRREGTFALARGAALTGERDLLELDVTVQLFAQRLELGAQALDGYRGGDGRRNPC